MAAMGDKDVIIESLLKRIEELHRQIVLLTDQNEYLITENYQLSHDNLKLQERIARLEKNSSTSSKPPSSDITNPPEEEPKGKKTDRKRGGQKGHKKHTRKKFTQEEIDETLVHKLSDEEVKRRGLIEFGADRISPAAGVIAKEAFLRHRPPRTIIYG